MQDGRLSALCWSHLLNAAAQFACRGCRLPALQGRYSFVGATPALEVVARGQQVCVPVRLRLLAWCLHVLPPLLLQAWQLLLRACPLLPQPRCCCPLQHGHYCNAWELLLGPRCCTACAAAQPLPLYQGSWAVATVPLLL